MGMRVATFATSDRMLNASLATQARLANLQMQQASGSLSTDYGGLGSSSKPLLDLEASLKTSQAYADAAESADGRVEAMHSALSSVTDLLTDFRAQLTSLMSSDSSSVSRAALTSAAEGYMAELASLLNTSYEGRYLFGGNSTLDLPVDLSGFTADASTQSTSYYLGDDAVTSVKISRDQTVSYGVTANDSAFEQESGVYPRRDIHLAVDKRKCIGCGLCVALAPDLMGMGSDGRAFAREPVVSWSPADGDFVHHCPTFAISAERVGAVPATALEGTQANESVSG